jgi:folate-binding protein YgfZ
MANAAEWPVGYPELQSSWVWRPMPEAGMFRLTGEDVQEWLQGQVTQDLRRVGEGESTMACLCKPTGQLEDVLRIRRLPDSWLVFCERPDIFGQRLEDFVIMEDVTGLRLTGIAATIQGPTASALGYVVPSDRLGHGGYDVLLNAPLPKPPFSDEAWNFATLEAGEPLLGIDTTDRTLPPEVGPAFEARTISYTKGCYAGQEVLMRIHSRGHTNKTLVGLMSPVELPPDPAIHRTAFHPDAGWIAFATLRNEVIAEGKVTISGIEASIHSLSRHWLNP